MQIVFSPRLCIKASQKFPVHPHLSPRQAPHTLLFPPAPPHTSPWLWSGDAGVKQLNEDCGRVSPKHLFESFLKWDRFNPTECAPREDSCVHTALRSRAGVSERFAEHLMVSGGWGQAPSIFLHLLQALSINIWGPFSATEEFILTTPLEEGISWL